MHQSNLCFPCVSEPIVDTVNEVDLLKLTLFVKFVPRPRVQTDNIYRFLNKLIVRSQYLGHIDLITPECLKPDFSYFESIQKILYLLL